MEDTEQRKQNVLARLEARQTQRRAVAVESNLLHFQETFSNSLTTLRNMLEKINSESSSFEGANSLNESQTELWKLQKYLAESASFLPSYESEKAQTQLLQVQSQLQSVQEKLQPKKKFGFRSRQKQGKTGSSNAGTGVERKTEEKAKVEEIEKSTERAVNISSRSGERVSIGSEADQIDVSLSDLRNCQVAIRGYPSTVHLSKLRNTTVVSCPVSTSVFVEDVEDSTLVVACQQLRMHHLRNSHVYVHVTSSAIIEDCQNVKVAPYSVSDVSERDFKKARLNLESNNWDKIQDFNWLSSDAPSPNWSILTDSERKMSFSFYFDFDTQ